jgi:hypothetical protein
MTSHVERRLSCAVASYFEANLPYPIQWTHLPMEGKRTAAEARLLKAMGVKSGWADYEIVKNGRVYFIEVKRPRVLKAEAGAYQAAGSLSDTQKEFRDTCIANSTPYAVCHSLAEVEAMLIMWGIPLKGRITA